MPLSPIKLYGEQKKVLFLPAKDPIQIKGVAGSGKTTVALYRAKHLLETQSNLFQEARVAIFTYNKTLVAYIKSVLPQITGGYQQNSDTIIARSRPGLNVQITNFHKWAYDFLEARNYQLLKGNKFLSDFEQDSTITEIIQNLKRTYPNSNVLTKSLDFFKEEISWMKGKLFIRSQDYLEARRVGRGTADRITKDDKSIIWQVYEGYKTKLTVIDKIDFDDYAILVLKEIEKTRNFQAPFTHIIVDEAQDLNKAQMLALSKIVDGSTNSISIIADAAQRIYKSGFTWSEIGINVQGGRTVTFRKNYRNSIEIANLAASLLKHEDDKSEFTEIEASRHSTSIPRLVFCKDPSDELNRLLSIVKGLDNNISDTVILHRNHSGCRSIESILNSNKYRTLFLRKNGIIPFRDGTIKICTLSSVKGLEFDNVIICGLSEGIIPYPQGFNGDNDEFHVSTERRLLYTAMTRAKENLFLLTSGKPTRYINELDSQLYIKEG